MPALVGALHLDFLEHQPLEHLLAQHVLWRRLELLLVQPLAHRGDLRVQVAVEHDPVVDDRDHPIEQGALRGELAGLGMRELCAQGAARAAPSVRATWVVKNRRMGP